MENEDLIQYINRLEKLNEEMDALKADSREVLKNARDNGFSPKAIREILKLRKMAKADRDEFEFEVGKYKEILNLN